MKQLNCVKCCLNSDDCEIDDCMVDDGCITEESYNSGLFDSCFGELVNQLTNYLFSAVYN